MYSRLGKRHKIGRCYVIDGSALAILVAKISVLPFGIKVHQLNFAMPEFKDPNGIQVLLRMLYRDLSEVQEKVLQGPTFTHLVKEAGLPGRLTAYIAKNVTARNMFDGNLWRAISLIQICVWKAGEDASTGRPILFIGRRPWSEAIKQYASEFGVTIIFTSNPVRIRATLWQIVPASAMNLLRSLRYRLSPRLVRFIALRSQYAPARRATSPLPSDQIQWAPRADSSSSRIIVPYYGQLNLGQPHLFSDLFFWQESPLEARDLLMSFGFPFAPLDDEKWKELSSHNLESVVTHPGATTNPEIPIFKPSGKTLDGELAQNYIRPSGRDGEWIKKQITNYRKTKSEWSELFSEYSAKVFVTWYKYDSAHMAIADAIQAHGGVTAIYQRAYESHPSAATSVNTDILFSFSQGMADVETQSKSEIRYHVTTGYLGDHRFTLLKGIAQLTRQKLEQQGAKRVLAYFDENSLDDPRWSAGHQLVRRDYAFLMNKVLETPWLGLVIKPKDPRSLRTRLGPVADLLKQAEETGRCIVHEGGAIQGSHTPAEAALAADLAVHGHLYAASAGLDSALAGVPTLLLDSEGWPVSPMYKLGIGRVIFNDWSALWEACSNHWSTTDGIPNFGDWSPILDEIDPFRDGRAAERMGTYLKWLIDDFKDGLDRDTVMSNAAERYCQAWGDDKIAEVNINHQFSQPAKTVSEMIPGACG